MDVLRQLIQTIVVIVILAVLLEMLLPRGDMRRYVKMVMGLLIIVAVLQTATGVMNSDLLREIPDITETPSGYAPVSLEDIMAAGQSLADANHREARQQYAEGIARQVTSLVSLNDTLRVIDTRVGLDEHSNNISSITVICTTSEAGLPGSPTGVIDEPAIQPVIIGTTEDNETAGSGSRPTAGELQAAADMANLVANFYNLRPEQVKIELQ